MTPSPGGREYAQAMADIMELRKHYNAERARAAILCRAPDCFPDRLRQSLGHFESQADDSLGHRSALDALLPRAEEHEAPVDVLTPDRDFSKYPFVVAPAFQLVDADLVRRFTDYVQEGGHLILTCRTGQKNMQGHLWEGPWAVPILPLIGARIPFYDVLPVGVNGHVSCRRKTYAWGIMGRDSGARERHRSAGDLCRSVLCRQAARQLRAS